MIVLAHGGAGRITQANQKPYQDGMQQALLHRENTALEAVIATCEALEEDPLFNAGCGSVLAADGQIRMDASLATSDGRTGAIGETALARSPIRAAWRIMEDSDHSLLVGGAADRWLISRGEASRPRDLLTEHQRELWNRWKAGEESDSLGTIGAVALDRNGGLAAGTSTGGLRGKAPGRVGDSAIVGAGTWCCSEAAISFTGDGDKILSRSSAARLAGKITAGKNPEEAIEEELRELHSVGADAGCIVLLRSGKYWARRNCQLLNWGVSENGKIHVPSAEA
jgi:beta-aspartyl-peptidase (threonine type)